MWLWKVYALDWSTSEIKASLNLRWRWWSKGGRVSTLALRHKERMPYSPWTPPSTQNNWVELNLFISHTLSQGWVGRAVCWCTSSGGALLFGNCSFNSVILRSIHVWFPISAWFQLWGILGGKDSINIEIMYFMIVVYHFFFTCNLKDPNLGTFQNHSQ